MHAIFKRLSCALTWSQRVYVRQVFRRKSDDTEFELDNLRKIFGGGGGSNPKPRAQSGWKENKPLPDQRQARSTDIRLSVVNPGGRADSKCVLLEVYNNITPNAPVTYMFNCGESTERILLSQERNSPSKISQLKHFQNIFITEVAWHNIGGVIGVLLSKLQAYGQKDSSVTLHGPPGLKDVSDCGKTKFVYSGLPQDLQDVTKIEVRSLESGPFVDENIEVQYVPLKPVKPTITTEREEEYLPSADDDLVVAYIVKPKQPVKWEQIFHKGINDKGAWMMDQQNNTAEVKIVNGRKMRPADITSHDPATVMLVLDCPSTDYLPAMLASKDIHALSEDNNVAQRMLVHMSPLEVVNHPSYQKFMDRFPQGTKHLMLNKNSVGPVFPPALSFSEVLHKLNPNLFPRLPIMNDVLEKYDDFASCGMSGDIVQGQHYLRYWFKGENTTGFDWSDRPYLREGHNHRGAVQKEIAHLKSNLRKFEENNPNRPKYPEVVFLGTACSSPQRWRNVTSILVNTGPDTSVMFDCGEGTLNQLTCRYGDRLDEVLCNLQMILVTHMHFDHTAGILNVAAARMKAFKRRGLPVQVLVVPSPKSLLKHYFWSQRNIFPDQHEYMMLIANYYFDEIGCDTYNSEIEEMVQGRLADLGLSKIQAIKMRHKDVKQSFGFILEGTSGWKIAFSGDTMPCQVFATLGQNCDLLIHECTYDDNYASRASLNKHSTTSEAIKIGQMMNAKFTMLTHFSSVFQYPLLPIRTRNFPPNVGYAYDYMTVSLSELPTVPMMEPALNSIYANKTVRLMQNKTEHSSQHKQLFRTGVRAN